MIRRLLATQAPAATVLIRIIVGAVSFTEGIQTDISTVKRVLGGGEYAT